MKRYIALLFLFCPLLAFSQIICEKADSIKIKHFSFDVYTAFNTPRRQFDNHFEKGKGSYPYFLKKLSYSEIQQLCQNLLRLNILPDSMIKIRPYDCMKKTLTTKRGNTVELDIDPLDVRGKIEIYSQGNLLVIWYDERFVDIGNNRYYMSNNLKRMLNFWFD